VPGGQRGDPIIDIHVHFGARPDSKSGYSWSAEFAKTPAYYAMSLLSDPCLKMIAFLATLQESLVLSDICKGGGSAF
jgi:hypothetical protein